MKNNSVIIVGGGYSIKEGIDQNLWQEIKGHNIWSLNIAYKTMPYIPNKEIWVDFDTFFKSYKEELLNLDCDLVSKTHAYYEKYHPEITTLKVTTKRENFYGREALKKEKIFLGLRGFCGVFALSYAVALGYNTIYLLGYDWNNGETETGTKAHYFEDDLDKYGIKRCYENPKYTAYVDKKGKIRKGIEDFELYLKIKDLKIYNVSLISNIPYFEKINYSKFFNLLKRS